MNSDDYFKLRDKTLNFEPTHAKKLIIITTNKEEYKKYSLWGRVGIRIGQFIGLIELNITK